MEISRDELMEIIQEAMNSNRHVSNQQHADDHAWISAYRDEVRIKRERWEKRKEHGVVWFMLTGFSALSYGLWEALKALWKVKTGSIN